ncbi:MAG TPA: hypothetical protein VEL79_19005 [Vicinamibacterales bacterium]|nr:hypothetical protein [Vicinamibacterales bacterium]
MPFELGLAVGIALADSRQRYEWRTLEQKAYRIQASLSDIAGYETSIHHGTVEGTLEALLDIFERLQSPPLDDLDDLRWVYRHLREYRNTLRRDIFRPKAFAQLVAAAKVFVDERSSVAV